MKNHICTIPISYSFMIMSALFSCKHKPCLFTYSRYLEPKWPLCCLKFGPSFEGFNPKIQDKQVPGMYIYIWTIFIYIYIYYVHHAFPLRFAKSPRVIGVNVTKPPPRVHATARLNWRSWENSSWPRRRRWQNKVRCAVLPWGVWLGKNLC